MLGLRSFLDATGDWCAAPGDDFVIRDRRSISIRFPEGAAPPAALSPPNAPAAARPGTPTLAPAASWKAAQKGARASSERDTALTGSDGGRMAAACSGVLRARVSYPPLPTPRHCPGTPAGWDRATSPGWMPLWQARGGMMRGRKRYENAKG